jgi:hypothetical protein
MLTAQNEELRYILRGTEVSSGSEALLQPGVTCPVCGKAVEYNPVADNPFAFFRHKDGSPNCFDSDRESVEHSRAVEVAFAVIHNRLAEITRGPVEIDIERRIGSSSKFVISDVRVTNPLKVTAEIFFGTDYIALGRRLSTLSKHDFRTWLIFHNDGVKKIETIERHMRKLTSVRVGRYNPETREVTLGGLFSPEKIDYDKASEVPNYIIYSPSEARASK